MTSANPPYPYFNGITYNSQYFASSLAVSGITLAQANALYLKKTTIDTATALETFNAGIATSSIDTTTAVPLVIGGAIASAVSILNASTDGVVNIANSQTNGTINIGVGDSRTSVGSISIGTGSAPANNINIGTGSGRTAGIISIGTGTLATGGSVSIGSSTIATTINGTLKAGAVGTGFRCVMLGQGVGSTSSSTGTITITGAPSLFGNPLVFISLNIINGSIPYFVNINVTGTNTFSYNKTFFNNAAATPATAISAASSETFNYIAVWI